MGGRHSLAAALIDQARVRGRGCGGGGVIDPLTVREAGVRGSANPPGRAASGGADWLLVRQPQGWAPVRPPGITGSMSTDEPVLRTRLAETNLDGQEPARGPSILTIKGSVGGIQSAESVPEMHERVARAGM